MKKATRSTDAAAAEGNDRKVGVGIVFNAGEEGKGPDGDGLVVNSLTKWAALSPPFQ